MVLEYGIDKLGEMDFHLHEDRVPNMEKDSIKLERWAKECGEFTTVYVSDPRNGRGPALNKLRKHARSKYVFYMEEDFDFVREFDLNVLVDLMEKHGGINQLSFPWRTMVKEKKPGGPNGQNFFEYEVRNFSGHILRVTDRWTWQPALWRRSWILPHWNFARRRSNKEFNGKFKKGCGSLEWSCKWMEKTFGSYHYKGSVGETEKIYIKHTSWDVRHDRMFL